MIINGNSVAINEKDNLLCAAWAVNIKENNNWDESEKGKFYFSEEILIRIRHLLVDYYDMSINLNSGNMNTNDREEIEFEIYYGDTLYTYDVICKFIEIWKDGDEYLQDLSIMFKKLMDENENYNYICINGL